jgi:sulfur-carrier protein
VVTIRVELPVHLRTLAGVEGELEVQVAGEPTVTTVLDEVESRFPALRGTIREHQSGKRRAYMRYFAAGRDLSHEPPETRLPEAVSSGEEVLRVLGAISGG